MKLSPSPGWVAETESPSPEIAIVLDKVATLLEYTHVYAEVGALPNIMLKWLFLF